MLSKLLVLLLISSYSLAQKSTNIGKYNANAEFPGGIVNLYHFIGKEMRCPEQLRAANMTGKIVVQFTVNTNGAVSNVKMIKSMGFGVDEALINVIKSMPKWLPAKKNGKTVKSTVTIPISDLCVDI